MSLTRIQIAQQYESFASIVGEDARRLRTLEQELAERVKKVTSDGIRLTKDLQVRVIGPRCA
jgi:hypothetical protein